jgi:hypothetical protein
MVTAGEAGPAYSLKESFQPAAPEGFSAAFLRPAFTNPDSLGVPAAYSSPSSLLKG